jgi:protein-S-isoprenylcysteine O-methyltransferase Ste14
MFSIGIVVLVLVMAYAGFSKAQRAGTWSWSKFALTLGFLAGVCAIVTAPLVLMNTNSPYFWWVYGAGWVIALGLMVWFIIQARRWKFPGARTDRDQPPPR